MASNGKKFALTLSSTTRYFKRRTGSNGSAHQEHDKRGGAVGWLAGGGQYPGGLSPVAIGVALPRSSSTGDVEYSPDITQDSGSPSVEGGDDMTSLAHRVHRISDLLHDLQAVVCASTRPPDPVTVEKIHSRLDEISQSVQIVIRTYPDLSASQVLLATSTLLDSCKNYCREENQGLDSDDLIVDINNLALALSDWCTEFMRLKLKTMCICLCDSMAKYFAAEVEHYSHGMIKTKSLDCLTAAEEEAAREQTSRDGGMVESLAVGDGLDDKLHGLESGVDIAFSRALAWSKYTKELTSYVERRSNLLMMLGTFQALQIKQGAEFARNINKLAKSVHQSINEESFLPFQTIYTTALSQDIELGTMSQAAKTLIQNQTFVGSLNARRNEHDKIRKNIKATWSRQVKKMHDAVANLRKARNTYISRQHDYDKMKDLALKAETESQSLISAGGSVAAKADARAEKRKKQEDEAMMKAMEAETFYKSCVEEANLTQQQLIIVKRGVLKDIRELLEVSDRELKVASVDYFKLMNTITETIPVQFLTLSDSCQTYQPGSHYFDFVQHIRLSDYPPTNAEPFLFVPYNTVGTRVGDSIVSDTQDGLPHGKVSGMRRLEDSDSLSGGSSLSLESSPTTSPYQSHQHRGHHEQDLHGDEDQPRYDYIEDGVGALFKGTRLSGAAQTHTLRKLRAPSRCRECESYVYFQGAECEKCGITSHRRCLETLRAVCSSSFTAAAVPYKEMLDVPELVKKCIQEINRRGLNIKGIYRLSSVKSKVEQVCCGFDEGSVNLSDQNPNVVANVLKLYLRQLPEPLLTFTLYQQFINLAKDHSEGRPLASVVSALTAVVEELPTFNYKTCMALMHHLYRVSRHGEVNHMNVTNLGIVFGPTLLRKRDEQDHRDCLGEAAHQSRVVELLVNNVKTIFGVEDTTGTDCDKDEMAGEPPLPEGPETLEGSISPTISWYAPESTQDLLQELAKEGPHFQQLQQSDRSLLSSPSVTLTSQPFLSPPSPAVTLSTPLSTAGSVVGASTSLQTTPDSNPVTSSCDQDLTSKTTSGAEHL